MNLSVDVNQVPPLHKAKQKEAVVVVVVAAVVLVAELMLAFVVAVVNAVVVPTLAVFDKSLFEAVVGV